MSNEPSNPPSQQATASEATPADAVGVSQSAATEYIARKLNPQRVWLDSKARRAKAFYYSLLGVSMVATTSIVLANSVHLALLTTALAVVATIATGASGLLRSQENWIRYRNAANGLESLKLKYEISAPPFDGPDRHRSIIEEAEKIFADEQSQWAMKVSETKAHRPPLAY